MILSWEEQQLFWNSNQEDNHVFPCDLLVILASYLDWNEETHSKICWVGGRILGMGAGGKRKFTLYIFWSEDQLAKLMLSWQIFLWPPSFFSPIRMSQQKKKVKYVLDLYTYKLYMYALLSVFCISVSGWFTSFCPSIWSTSLSEIRKTATSTLGEPDKSVVWHIQIRASGSAQSHHFITDRWYYKCKNIQHCKWQILKGKTNLCNLPCITASVP